VDIQGKPPQWHLASHAACATEAILSMSFVDSGDMGLACSANSICSACHLSDVSTECAITSLSHTMMDTYHIQHIVTYNITLVHTRMQDVLYAEYKYELPSGGSSACCVKDIPTQSIRSLLGRTEGRIQDHGSRNTIKEGGSRAMLVGAIGGWDGVLRLFDIGTGNAIRSIRSHYNVGIYAVDLWCPRGGEEVDEEYDSYHASAMVAVGDKNGRLSVYYI
jgi:hypothetical protein